MITSVTQVSGFYDISVADHVYITELVEKLKPIQESILLRKKYVMKNEQGCKITAPKCYNREGVVHECRSTDFRKVQ